MLESLITSRTRLKMLLKFFINSHSTAYLRGLAEEFQESTNAIRHELNNLTKASYLVAKENGRTIEYRANTEHPLYPEIKSLVHKYLGLDKIVEHILAKLGMLYYAFITGDYARGKDSGVIELVLVGEIDEGYLMKYVVQVEELICRKISVRAITLEMFEMEKHYFSAELALVMWTDK